MKVIINLQRVRTHLMAALDGELNNGLLQELTELYDKATELQERVKRSTTDEFPRTHTLSRQNGS